jgi:hypothetical protein
MQIPRHAGPPGVGKTHRAVSLGLKAIEAGHRVFVTTPRLLIIDEIGDSAERKTPDRARRIAAKRQHNLTGWGNPTTRLETVENFAFAFSGDMMMSDQVVAGARSAINSIP